MTGSDQVRFCQRCEKRVYNLSALPAAEAEALLARKRLWMCVRFARRADGTVIAGDCAGGPTRQPLPAVLVAASLLVSAVGCAEEPPAATQASASVEQQTAEVAATPPSIGAPTPEDARREEYLRKQELEEVKWTAGGPRPAPTQIDMCPRGWKRVKRGQKSRIKGSSNSELKCRPLRRGERPADCDPNDPLCGL